MGVIGKIAKNLFARKRVERDLDEELGAYMDSLTAENMKAGMTRQEAVKAAARPVSRLRPPSVAGARSLHCRGGATI